MRIRSISGDRRGATAIEYGFLAAFIAIAIAVAVTGLGTKLAAVLTNIAAGFKLS